MGNSSSARRRTQSATTASPTHRASAPVAAKAEKSRQRSGSQNFIDDKNFAPRKAVQSDFSENSECPICFLNYEDLNVATCCKQMICTDCYLLMKNTALHDASKCPCPFCSNETLNVTYTPTKRAVMKISGPAPGPSPFKAVNSTSNDGIASSSSSSTCGYETTSSNGADSASRTPVSTVPCTLHVPVSSISDRRDIEIEIQQQRLRFADDQPPPCHSTSRTRGSDSYMEVFAQVNGRRNLGASDFGNRSSASDYENAALRLRFAVALGERNNDRITQILGISDGSGSHLGGISRSGSSDRRLGDQEAMNNYGNLGLGRTSVNDLERIEEMMMMEAIRQSIASSPSSSMSPIMLHSSGSGDAGSVGGGRGEGEGGPSALTSKVSSSSLAPTVSTTTFKSNTGESERETGSGDVNAAETVEEKGGAYGESWANSKCSPPLPESEQGLFLHGNLSDCESDVGVSVIAWEESLKNEELMRNEGDDEAIYVPSCVGREANVTVGVKSESGLLEESPTMRLPISRGRSPSTVPRPQGGRFSDASLHINQCSAAAEILEQREKHGELPTEFRSSNLLETIDIALGRKQVHSDLQSSSAVDGAEDGAGSGSGSSLSHLWAEQTKEADQGEEGQGEGEAEPEGASDDRENETDKGTERDSSEGLDDHIFADVEEQEEVQESAEREGEGEVVFHDCEEGAEEVFSLHDDEEEIEYDSEEEKCEEDDSEDREVIILSVVLNPPSSPFSDNKIFDSPLDAEAPIFL